MAEEPPRSTGPMLSGGAGTPPSRASTGFTVWLTGLSGSGKSTIAAILERRLRAAGRREACWDGE